MKNNNLQEFVQKFSGLKNCIIESILFECKSSELVSGFSITDDDYVGNFTYFLGKIFDSFLLNLNGINSGFDSKINLLSTRFFDFIQINNISLPDLLFFIESLESNILSHSFLDEYNDISKNIAIIFFEIRSSFTYLYNSNVLKLLNQYKNVMDKSSIITKINIHYDLTYANNEFCNLSGYSINELIGKQFKLIFCSGDNEEKDCEYNNVIDIISNKKIRQGIIKSRKKDGTYYWIKSTIMPIIDENDNILEYMAVTIDITDMILARENIKKSFEKLQELDAKKDDFINIVSHELRTPMSAMKGYLSMIMDGDMGKIPNDAMYAIRKSYESLEGLIEIVNSMFDITRVEKGTLHYNKENVDVISFFESIHRDLEIVGKNYSILLILDIDNNLTGSKFFIDSNKLKQVIINLVSNAFKFSKEFGKVFIKITKDENRLLVEIIDEGVGIPEDKLLNIFSKFYQVDSYKQRKVEGLGLGLALSQTIIKDFGSEIKVKSKLGEGSTFYFYIDLIK